MKYLQATTRKGCGNQGYLSYDVDDCDVIVIVYENELWVIPIEDLKGYQTVTVKNGQEIRRSDSRSFKPDQYKVR